jgi:hypothetical protein
MLGFSPISALPLAGLEVVAVAGVATADSLQRIGALLQFVELGWPEGLPDSGRIGDLVDARLPLPFDDAAAAHQRIGDPVAGVLAGPPFVGLESAAGIGSSSSLPAGRAIEGGVNEQAAIDAGIATSRSIGAGLRQRRRIGGASH